jgi:hypothetical protein
MSDTPPAHVREQVAARASYHCEYCRSPVKFAVQSFECEHIVPTSLGGQTTIDNLAFACGGCNRCKAAKTTGIDPENGQETPLFHPRHQNWQDHFTWSADFSLIIGLTAVGRATIHALRLNRSGVINLRQVLVFAGEHPPIDL